MSYVTGSHAIKVRHADPLRREEVRHRTARRSNYRVQNGIPNQVTLYAYPLVFHEYMKALMGIYAQDQWTLKRLTMSGGIRYDYD